MESDDQSKLIERLERFRRDLGAYGKLITSLRLVTEWGLHLASAGQRREEVESLRQRLIREASALKPIVDRYGGVCAFQPPLANYIIRNYDPFSGGLGTTLPPSGSVLIDLEKAMDLVDRAIGALEAEKGGLASHAPGPRPTKQAFIAHGGQSEALNKLCEFLDVLGVKPVVAERMPSEGRSVNENVEHWLAQCDCGVVLATGDDLVNGCLQPRGNVNIEIGRFQERFAGRIIFLLEEGTAFPSNVSEKVWARFSDDRMDEAFLKVVRELKAFDII